jgi:hypothetical protein
MMAITKETFERLRQLVTDNVCQVRQPPAALRQIAADIAELERMQWQPIETAPKDGLSVLLYEDFEPAICAGYWGLESEAWISHRSQSFWRPPTHWMPIQKPEPEGK